MSNVKVSGALPGDWGLRKAMEMHRQLAAKCDRAIGAERNQLLAEIEKLEQFIEIASMSSAQTAKNRLRKLVKKARA